LIPRVLGARNLRGDFGRAGLAVTVLASLALPVCGFLDPFAARKSYFLLVTFHAWLELAVIAHLMVRK
jgi:hypothetical protein